MKCDYLRSVDESADITLPSSSKPKFILIPSLMIFPEAPVFLILSEPAKSTK